MISSELLVTSSLKLYAYARGCVLKKEQPEISANRMLFIHPPKSAGLSIREALFGDKILRGHPPAVYWQARLQGQYKQLDVFSVLRHPEARFRSAFFFLQSGGLTARDQLLSERLGLPGLDYASFVRRLDDKPSYALQVLRVRHFLPQTWYLTDLRGRLIVEHLFAIERPERLLEWASHKLGRHVEIARGNRTDYSASTYSEDALRDIWSKSAFCSRNYAEDQRLWKSITDA